MSYQIINYDHATHGQIETTLESALDAVHKDMGWDEIVISDGRPGPFGMKKGSIAYCYPSQAVRATDPHGFQAPWLIQLGECR
jgi:hypothetical protein